MKRSRWILAFLVLALVAASCGRSDNKGTTATTAGGTATTAGAANCKKEPLKATDVGVTADAITVEVMADVGSPLAPGLFQGDLDALNGYATYVNANGGIGCRKLVVKTWDSKLNADESKNGLIDSCANAVAMVGGNALFNPDVKTLVDCKDSSGAATGLPDIAALANDINEQCNPTTYMIQAVSEHCPITAGQPRPLTVNIGIQKYFLKQTPGLHGVYLVPGDLPTTVQSATFIIRSQETAGIKFDATAKVSGRDEQSAYTPKVQALKAASATYLYDGSNDRAMINMRKEAKAQGVDSVKVWACSLACYTRNMLSGGGTDVEGTYVWMQFLPFEEAGENKELKAYIDSVGANKVDSFGANAWQAAATFKQVIDGIVKTDGPNGITRKAVLAGLKSIGEVDANGWMGKKDLKGLSPCFLVMQIKGGKFVRVYPAKAGTMDCDPANLATVTLDPAAEAAKIK
jgi:hypothetical protein